MESQTVEITSAGIRKILNKYTVFHNLSILQLKVYSKTVD